VRIIKDKSDEIKKIKKFDVTIDITTKSKYIIDVTFKVTTKEEE